MITKLNVQRPVGFSDKNDCTVISFATAVGIPYKEAHAIMALGGRENYQPFNTYAWLQVLAKYGKVTRMCRTAINCPTIAQFIKDHPIGTYIIGVNGHALTIKDSVIFDNRETSLRWRIRRFVEIK